jgi:hypothetical protein
VALISADFGAGFRNGFFGGMRNDFTRVKNVIGSPLLKWLFVLISIYLLAFFPLMLLDAKRVISTKFFVRLYLPIWLTIGVAGLLLDWLRGNEDG